MLSDREQLSDYRLDERFRPREFLNELQQVLNFEQVMDSKISQNFIPFLITKKNILPKKEETEGGGKSTVPDH